MDVERIRKEFPILATKMQGKPLMSSEGGWGVHGVTDPDMQAAWVSHWLLIGAGLSQSANYQFAVWYAWGTNQASGDLETTQGQLSPAGLAYNQVYKWLAGQQASPCVNSGSIWSCALSSATRSALP